MILASGRCPGAGKRKGRGSVSCGAPRPQGRGWTLPLALSKGCSEAAGQGVAVAMAGCPLARGGRHQLTGPQSHSGAHLHALSLFPRSQVGALLCLDVGLPPVPWGCVRRMPTPAGSAGSLAFPGQARRGWGAASSPTGCSSRSPTSEASVGLSPALPAWPPRVAPGRAASGTLPPSCPPSPSPSPIWKQRQILSQHPVIKG